MSKIKEEIEKLIVSNQIDKLDKLISSYIKNNRNRDSNIKEISQILPIIMENTNPKNYYWLNCKEIILANKDDFIRNIDKIKYNNDTFLFVRVIDNIKALDTKLELSPKEVYNVLEKILKCDLTLNGYEIASLFDLFVYKDNIDLRAILEKYIKNIKASKGTTEYILNRRKKYIDIIYDNIDTIVTTPNIDLLSIRDSLSERKDLIKKINDLIDENPYHYIVSVIRNICEYFLSEKQNNNEYDTIIDIVYLILEDIQKNEHVKFSSLKQIGRGSYTIVLELGSKVIKIGNKRKTKSFPNNPYINAPLLRKEFKVDSKNQLFIEVNEKVDTKTPITEEELYQLYKKVRDLGIVWTDIAERNVGRLLKDNKISWRQELPITDQILGLEEYKGIEQLKRGDIVILDNDFIYDENTPKEQMKIVNRETYNIFEKRYQEEKKEELKNTPKRH